MLSLPFGKWNIFVRRNNLEKLHSSRFFIPYLFVGIFYWFKVIVQPNGFCFSSSRTTKRFRILKYSLILLIYSTKLTRSLLKGITADDISTVHVSSHF